MGARGAAGAAGARVPGGSLPGSGRAATRAWAGRGLGSGSERLGVRSGLRIGRGRPPWGLGTAQGSTGPPVRGGGGTSAQAGRAAGRRVGTGSARGVRPGRGAAGRGRLVARVGLVVSGGVGRRLRRGRGAALPKWPPVRRSGAPVVTALGSPRPVLGRIGPRVFRARRAAGAGRGSGVVGARPCGDGLSRPLGARRVATRARSWGGLPRRSPVPDGGQATPSRRCLCSRATHQAAALPRRRCWSTVMGPSLRPRSAGLRPAAR